MLLMGEWRCQALPAPLALPPDPILWPQTLLLWVPPWAAPRMPSTTEGGSPR